MEGSKHNKYSQQNVERFLAAAREGNPRASEVFSDASDTHAAAKIAKGMNRRNQVFPMSKLMENARTALQAVSLLKKTKKGS